MLRISEGFTYDKATIRIIISVVLGSRVRVRVSDLGEVKD